MSSAHAAGPWDADIVGHTSPVFLANEYNTLFAENQRLREELTRLAVCSSAVRVPNSTDGDMFLGALSDARAALGVQS